MPDVVTIVFLGVIGVILLSLPVMVVISVRRLAQRTRELQAFAAGQGFTYTAKEKLPDDLRTLPYFTRGVQWFGRNIKNVMRRRRNGEDTLIFDYWYSQTTGVALRTTRTTRSTVVCLRKKEPEPWVVFPEDGFQYLPADELRAFLEQSHATWKHSNPHR